VGKQRANKNLGGGQMPIVSSVPGVSKGQTGGVRATNSTWLVKILLSESPPRTNDAAKKNRRRGGGRPTKEEEGSE